MHHSKGIGLIEVLLSVVVLSVGLIACYRPLLASMDALQYADERIQANHVLSNHVWSVEGKARSEGKIKQGLQSETVKNYQVMSMTSFSTEDERLAKTDYRVVWNHTHQKKEIKREIYLTQPKKENTIA